MDDNLSTMDQPSIPPYDGESLLPSKSTIREKINIKKKLNSNKNESEV